MKIKLGKCSLFEPDSRALKSCLIGTLGIFMILFAFKFSIIWYVVAFISEILMLIWLETIYYPYGVKEEDLKCIVKPWDGK